jgi:hypothetical protein
MSGRQATSGRQPEVEGPRVPGDQRLPAGRGPQADRLRAGLFFLAILKKK